MTNTSTAAPPVRFRVRSGWTPVDALLLLVLVPLAYLDLGLLAASFVGPLVGAALGLTIRSRRRVRELVVDPDGTLTALTASNRIRFAPDETVRVRGPRWSRGGWFDGAGFTHNFVLTDDVQAALALRRARGGSVVGREASAIERFLRDLRDGSRRWLWAVTALVAAVGALASAVHEWNVIRDEERAWQTVPVTELVDRGVASETRTSGNSLVVEQWQVWEVTYELDGQRHTAELRGELPGIDEQPTVDVRRSDPTQVRHTPPSALLHVGLGRLASLAVWGGAFLVLARLALMLALLPVVRPVARPQPPVALPAVC